MKCNSCGSYNTRRTGNEEPPEDTDSELSSDSDMDDDNEAGVTPFERHISQLLRSLSARVRALEREGEGSDFDTDRDSDNDLPDMLDDGITYDDDDDDDEVDDGSVPLRVEEITGHTFVSQYPEPESDDHSSTQDSADSWQTDEEEEFIGVESDLPFGVSDEILEDTSPDSGFGDGIHSALSDTSEVGQTCSVMWLPVVCNSRYASESRCMLVVGQLTSNWVYIVSP